MDTSHFDSLARGYDAWKRKNWYYYSRLKRLVRRHVPARKKVLEIGTATGDILACTDPAAGTGIDTSPRMIDVAREKYRQNPCLRFIAGPLENAALAPEFDHIVLVDVVEHVEDVEGLVRAIRAVCAPETEVFVSMANPRWEPLLLLLEKLRLKMPEGDHYRLSSKKLVQLFLAQRFTMKEHGCDTVFPFYIPLVSALINRVCPFLPGLSKIGVIEYFVFS